MQYKELKISEIVENDYNPNEMNEDTYEHLKQEIERVGFLLPVVVRQKGTKFVVIDGEHRYRAAKDLKHQKIPSVIVETTEEEAKIQTINLNKIKGSFNPIKYARLLTNLALNLNPNDMTKLLRVSPDELSSYKLLLEMPSEFQLTTSRPEPLDETIYTFTVPNNQKHIIEDALTKAEGDTNDAKLVNMCREYAKTKRKENGRTPKTSAE